MIEIKSKINRGREKGIVQQERLITRQKDIYLGSCISRPAQVSAWKVSAQGNKLKVGNISLFHKQSDKFLSGYVLPSFLSKIVKMPFTLFAEPAFIEDSFWFLMTNKYRYQISLSYQNGYIFISNYLLMEILPMYYVLASPQTFSIRQIHAKSFAKLPKGCLIIKFHTIHAKSFAKWPKRCLIK